MLTGTLNSIREEKARKARDIEYIREMASEDSLEDRMMYLEQSLVKPTGNIYLEAAETLNSLSGEDNFSETEVSRILNSDHDLTFDEMIGITD